MTTPPQMLAPIAIFVFKRPDHTRRMLDGLIANPEFARSPLYVFSDGARNAAEVTQVEQVRELINELTHPNKTVFNAAANQGLAKSITQGVTQLCTEFGHVIVVEDDLAVGATFLHYMNSALKRYADEPRVMQVSGHMFPVDLQADTDAVFMPVTTSWGWATWQRAWVHMCMNPQAAVQQLESRRWRRQFDLGGAFPYARMLALRLAGRNQSWAIWWYFSVFGNQGLVLFPTKTLVNNEGFDGSGTHCADKDVVFSALENVRIKHFPDVAANAKAFKAYRHFLMRDRGLLKRNFDRLWRIFFSTRNLHVG